MVISEPILVSLTDLVLDVENPRYGDEVKNQIDAIQSMFENQKDKILYLAEDIVDEGLNPSENLIVIKSTENENRYIVLEGNRRLTALKLLETPTILSKLVPEAQRKRLQALSYRYKINPIDSVNCTVFPYREIANKWIKLKHTGANKGVGVDSWGGTEVARFNQRDGKQSPALQLIDYMKKKPELDQEIKDKIENIAITNLARLLSDSHIQNLLGIKIKDQQIYSDLPKEEVFKGFEKIIRDLAHKTINVNDIYDKKDRLDYIETFKPDEIPDSNKTAQETWIVIAQENKPLAKKKDSNQQQAKTSKTVKRSKPVVSTRKSLIPSSCVIKINHQRINHLYRELKSIDLDKLPNAGAIMFRVFFEMSIEEYISKFNLSVHKDSKLKLKLSSVTEYMRVNNVLNRNELKPINLAISNPDSLLSVDTLHSYVHNSNVVPKSKDLKLMWEELQLFMEKLWE